MTLAPFFERDGIAVYCGDVRDVLPQLDLAEVGCVVADPPYGETELAWDRWPDGWALELADCLPEPAPLWCFGSMRMFLEHTDEFELRAWKFAQDVVWEKHNGSGFHADRFRRVHEHVVQWYRGEWDAVFKAPQFTMDATARSVRRKGRPAHMGEIDGSLYVSEDGGPRLTRSVMLVRSEHGRAIHPTQKPIGIVEPMVRYSARPGSVVLDLFSGSGTTAVVAKSLGLRCIAIEADERWCREIVGRLTQEIRFPATASAASPISARSLAPSVESGGSGVPETTGDTVGTTCGRAAPSPDLAAAADGRLSGRTLTDETGTAGGAGPAAPTLDCASEDAARATGARGQNAVRETVAAEPLRAESAEQPNGGADHALTTATPSGASTTPRAAAPTSRSAAAPKRLDIRIVGEDGSERALEVAGG